MTFWKVLSKSIGHILCTKMFAVLRFLRFEREILHRDISKGNIMVSEDGPSTSATIDAESVGVHENSLTKEVRFCFVKYLLKQR